MSIINANVSCWVYRQEDTSHPLSRPTLGNPDFLDVCIAWITAYINVSLKDAFEGLTDGQFSPVHLYRCFIEAGGVGQIPYLLPPKKTATGWKVDCIEIKQGSAWTSRYNVIGSTPLFSATGAAPENKFSSMYLTLALVEFTF